MANPANTVDYSSHLLSATLPISIQHFLKYSESIKKETSLVNNGIGNGTSNNGLSANNLSNISSSMNSNLNLGGMDVNGLNMSNGFNLKSDILGGLKNGITPNLNLALNQVNNIAMQAHQQHSQSHHNHHSLSNLNSNNSVSTNPSTGSSINNTTTNVTNHATEIIDSVATTTAPIITNTTANGKKKKKKPPKEKKPRPKPGEIRETKALDGSTLYCCPECQMAYPDRSLIEQHVISHAVERRCKFLANAFLNFVMNRSFTLKNFDTFNLFRKNKVVCDICGAALKRKDHLTRHKLSHIPDRPHVCNVCLYFSSN